MTSLLQPVDTTEGRSFKVAFRRLVVDHVLSYLERNKNKDFKLTKLVTIYHGVRLMAKVRDIIPKYGVLNSWIKTKILAPFQSFEVKKKGWEEGEGKETNERKLFRVRVYHARETSESY